MNEINVILNGKPVKGNKDENILSLSKRNGFDIPTMCNDDRLEPFSSCYVCVVEIEGMKTLQPACSTIITEGMKIETKSNRVVKARKTALELLLSNHYADCVGPCKQTCPAGVDVQGYISLIDKGMYSEAIALIKETNPLPAICGRVCVRPCEVACRRNLLGEDNAVGIDYMKRFAADNDLNSPNKYIPKLKPSTGKKVAVIGAGPAGLSSAFFLQKEGHQVDIYEASPKAGGWLRYGIPEYRLPNDLLQKEVDNITELGAKIFYNQRLGDNISYNEIKLKYDAAILAIGCQGGTSIGCEGDDAENVFSGIDFLKKMELSGKKYDFSNKTIAVIGGGNTAMDCCRSSLRCGAKKVMVIYRRTEKEMPANPIEIHESKLEGVEYMFLTAPVKVNKDEQGKLKSIKCIKMDLGEPDASGRRRPIPVKNSEFDVEVDFALAAIGQKTVADFLTDINKNSDNGELTITKWGDIEAEPSTLQTKIKNIFAAGDGVTGAATLIQAIAQAKVASLSCHQFLTNQPILPEKKEFLSKKDNFKLQIIDDYLDKFTKQSREEMPTLEPKERNNFKEVELGYASEKIVQKEAQRCLECGCVEYFTCDLKKFSSEYEANQKHYEGQFKEFEVDFRHPFIEIDNNKCILCSRCIRICREVVGANALGLINRGFDTYVVPSMHEKLQDTTCESCGLCISACPTGAITENFKFKPGPVKLESFQTICHYCSVGCEITMHHKNGYIMKVTGSKGKVNKDGNLCRFPKFGYNIINSNNRIKKPLLKVDGKFKEIEFEEAFSIIADKIKSVNADENAFYAGARLTNEEMYLVQKLARLGAKTNNITSFHYLDRGMGFVHNSIANVPFEEIKGASKIYFIGGEINKDNAVTGFMIQNAHYLNEIPIELLTVKSNSAMKHKVDKVLLVKSYYYFIKAVNHYLLSSKLENRLFINSNCRNFDDYKHTIIAEDYLQFCENAGVSKEIIANFANDYNKQLKAIIVFSEKEISANTSLEIFNLAMITGKLGKTSNGLISLKEKNNAQGLFDMGISANVGVGGVSFTNTNFLNKLQKTWKVKELPTKIIEQQFALLDKGLLKNLFIFGEDPIGCAIDKDIINKCIANSKFVMVQDYFLTETAKKADLIMPSSYSFEQGGSFTNTQKVYQKIDMQIDANNPYTSYKQLIKLLKKFDSNGLTDVEDVMNEIISLLPNKEKDNYQFINTNEDNSNRMFNFGCDILVKTFEEYFNNAFSEK